MFTLGNYIFNLNIVFFNRLGHFFTGSGRCHGTSSGAGLVTAGADSSTHEQHEAQAFYLYPRLYCSEPREQS